MPIMTHFVDRSGSIDGSCLFIAEAKGADKTWEIILSNADVVCLGFDIVMLMLMLGKMTPNHVQYREYKHNTHYMYKMLHQSHGESLRITNQLLINPNCQFGCLMVAKTTGKTASLTQYTTYTYTHTHHIIIINHSTKHIHFVHVMFTWLPHPRSLRKVGKEHKRYTK